MSFTINVSSNQLSSSIGPYGLDPGLEPGVYARFKLPRGVPLPRNEDGTEFTFNVNTGNYEGTVYNTDFLTLDWLKTATTVRTIKTSGGNYTPSQYPQALQDAATANDFRVLVVDDGLTLAWPGTSFPSKTGSANWTWTVPASYWNEIWTPELDRTNDPSMPKYYHRAAESARGYFISGGSFGNQSNIGAFDQPGKNRYGFIGAKMWRTIAPIDMILLGYIANPNATSLDELPTEWIWKWCEFDGIWKQGSTYYETRVGMRFEGNKAAFLNCSMIGFAGTGTDPQSIIAVNGGKRVKVIECLLEAAGENILIGGGTNSATSDWFRPSDWEIRRCYFTKRQDWNPSSTLWNPTGPSPVVKNLFETKDGHRLLFEDCVFENSWVNGQDGPGIVIKTTSQSSVDGFYHTDGVVFSHCAVLNCTKPIAFIARDGGVIAEWLIIEPSSHIHFRNCLFEIGLPNELNSSFGPDNTGGAAMQMNGTVSDPLGRPVGPMTVRWSTFVSRASGGIGTFIFALTNRDFFGWDFSDNVVDRCFYGINGDGIGNGTLTDAATLRQNKMFSFRRNVLVPTTWLDRDNWQQDFPLQYNPPVLWPASRAAIGFTDFNNRNYTLSGSSPVKGLGEGGFDPGYDKTILDARLQGIRNATPFQVTYV